MFSPKWHNFAICGDEWLISYACAPALWCSVPFFSVGHALELYLKASYTKISGDSEKAIKYGHDLKKLWDDCKKGDSNFLSHYTLVDTLFDDNIDLVGRGALNSLKPDEVEGFFRFYELYLCMKYLPDLKYMGLPWNRRRRVGNSQMATALIAHNPMWSELFRNLRAYLGHPAQGHLDLISEFLLENKVNASVEEFLSSVINK